MYLAEKILCCITVYSMNNWLTDDLPFLAVTWASVNDSTDLVRLLITFSNILHILFVIDIPLLLSNSSLSDFLLSMLVVFNLFHDIGTVLFSNILLNVWDNDFVYSPPWYFMSSFLLSGPELLLFLSDFIACCTYFSLMGLFILSFWCFLFSCNFSISFSLNLVQDLCYVDDIFLIQFFVKKLCVLFYMFFVEHLFTILNFYSIQIFWVAFVNLSY